jgi:hypothetical protein
MGVDLTSTLAVVGAAALVLGGYRYARGSTTASATWYTVSHPRRP